MLEKFFIVDSNVDGAQFYLNRSILSASLVISAMQRLGKELTGTTILEVFQNEELIREIQSEFTHKFPDSEESLMFSKFQNQKSGGYFESCFEIITPLISRLEVRNNLSA